MGCHLHLLCRSVIAVGAFIGPETQMLAIVMALEVRLPVGRVSAVRSSSVNGWLNLFPEGRHGVPGSSNSSGVQSMAKGVDGGGA